MRRFVEVLEKEFGISATPRMRRGIDINAGCGQLTASVKKKEGVNEMLELSRTKGLPAVGVYEDEGRRDDAAEDDDSDSSPGTMADFTIDRASVNLDDEEASASAVDPTFDDEFELAEVERLLALVEGTSISPISSPLRSKSPEETASVALELASTVRTSTITDEGAMRKAQRRRKKLQKHLKAIDKLRDIEAAGTALNQEQLDKVAKEKEWIVELESVEHNLM